MAGTIDPVIDVIWKIYDRRRANRSGKLRCANLHKFREQEQCPQFVALFNDSVANVAADRSVAYDPYFHSVFRI